MIEACKGWGWVVRVAVGTLGLRPCSMQTLQGWA